MRFKLDENVDLRCRELLAAGGHDVATVAEEHLGGAEDADVAERCLEEGRCLITADQDFAQIVDYPPEKYAGLIVLRHPRPTL